MVEKWNVGFFLPRRYGVHGESTEKEEWINGRMENWNDGRNLEDDEHNLHNR